MWNSNRPYIKILCMPPFHFWIWCGPLNINFPKTDIPKMQISLAMSKIVCLALWMVNAACSLHNTLVCLWTEESLLINFTRIRRCKKCVSLMMASYERIFIIIFYVYISFLGFSALKTSISWESHHTGRIKEIIEFRNESFAFN